MLEPAESVDRLTALVAIVRAAWLIGDKELERSGKQELSDRFGIKLTFANAAAIKSLEVSDD